MKRCLECVMPDTRPDTPFVDGVCQACRNAKKRPRVDWAKRKAALVDLLNQHQGRCIVASSGGKDSHWQVKALLDLGVSPIVVTAETCHLTPIGEKNIVNLSNYAPTIRVAMRPEVRAELNRAGIELVGDISWPEHVAIFTIPFRQAARLEIPLIFYGENPQDAYGGPDGSEYAFELTPKWRAEFGGFLGLRPNDLIGWEGLTQADMEELYLPPATERPPRAYFLGQFLDWDPHRNAQEAIAMGMQFERPTPANWWGWENLDNAQTGLHDHLMYRKYGYGRGCAQVSIDIRAGRVNRSTALTWVEKNDGQFPWSYAGVPIEEVLERIAMHKQTLRTWLNRFTDPSIFGEPKHLHMYSWWPRWV